MNLSIRFMKNRFFFLVVIAFVSLLFSSCHKDRAEYYIFFIMGTVGDYTMENRKKLPRCMITLKTFLSGILRISMDTCSVIVGQRFRLKNRLMMIRPASNLNRSLLT